MCLVPAAYMCVGMAVVGGVSQWVMFASLMAGAYGGDGGAKHTRSQSCQALC